MYLIVNKFTGDYWNNDLGWTDTKELAEAFADTDLWDLPIDGEWIVKQ